MRTEPPASAPSAFDTAWAESIDFDNPTVTAQERLAAMRALLTQRINIEPQPSRTINQLHAAHARCTRTFRELEQMLWRAPRILSVIRHTLREAFALDPDSLLFTEPLLPQTAVRVDSLTDRTLALFHDPGVPINLHHFTALSLRDVPDRALPFTATQALARVNQLAMAARINAAMANYWQQLAPGSWLSRRERWVELRTQAFADQAYLAQQVFGLSNRGYAMVKQLVEAPDAQARQHAGGAWATLQVRTLLWPHIGAGSLAIPGALHLYREGAADGPQVIYLPGLQRVFHEFGSWYEVQEQLPARVQHALFSVLWHSLPFKRKDIGLLQPGTSLTQDALAHSASAMLDAQWHSEWGAVLSFNYAAPMLTPTPPLSRRLSSLLRFIEKGRKRLIIGLPFATTLDALLEWDRQRRAVEIGFASLSPDLPRKMRQAQLRRYESAIGALLDAKASARESAAYEAFLALESERHAQAQVVDRWLQAEDAELLKVKFWNERPEGALKRASLILNAQRRALRQVAQLERRLQLIEQPHLDRLLEVLDKPKAAQRGNSDTRVVRVSVGGRTGDPYTLMGAFVVTTARALAEPNLQQPVLLSVSGQFGGLAAFDHLEALSQGLRASFSSRDGSVLWRCIGRDVRDAARTALAGPVQVSYSVADSDVQYEDFKAMVEHHARLHQRLNQPQRLFSEVSDPTLGRMLLAEELREHLQVPVNQTLGRALANVAFVRFAAGQAHTQPSWLATASNSERKRYTRLQQRYLSSAMAVENRLWQVLPPLQVFARDQLISRLTRDGFYPALDIEAPLLNMPDDVSAHFCGWTSQCVVGDRHVKMTVSRERSTFSLLQLALHNLDPQAPWTQWRLKRAHYLLPQWQARLSPGYLVKTLSSLDIGGQYDHVIRRIFAPDAVDLPRRVIDRATLQLAQMQVYSAARQGLSAQSQSLFNTVMAARSVVDLNKDGQQISLAFVRLRGHTLAHDRHLAGLLVIIDPCSGRCLVYWPTALDYPVLAEHKDLQQAHAALNRAGASASTLRALAQRVAPGWEEEALASYPGQAPIARQPAVLLSPIAPWRIKAFGVLTVYEALSRFVHSFKIKHSMPAAELSVIEAQIKEQIEAEPTAWLDIVPTGHCDFLALFAHARLLETQQRAHAQATSGATLTHYREQRLGEQWAATVRGLLSFIPVIGVGISLYEMLLAARHYHLSGRPEDAVDVAFLTLMAFVDVLTSFSPTPKRVRIGTLGRGVSQLHRRDGYMARLPTPPRFTTVLERFNKPLSIDGAVPLRGFGEKGVYVKNAELFAVEGERRYPVYRRKNEASFRLKNPQEPGADELILDIHEPAQWLLGADAPPPQPGPSSGRLNPFRQAPGPRWSPPSRDSIQAAVRRSPPPPTHAWQEWRTDIIAPLPPASPTPGLFVVQVKPEVPLDSLPFVDTSRTSRFQAVSPEPNYNVVQLDSNYYRVLPQGTDAPLDQTIFITKDQRLVTHVADEIERWLSDRTHEQPIPATLDATGSWRVHRPLFDGPLEATVLQAFPRLTASSSRFAGRRLIELSDPGRTASATHLLNVRATLDDWLTVREGKIGQTDDLFRILRPSELTGVESVFIGYEGASPGFSRIDFRVPGSLNHALRRPVVASLGSQQRRYALNASRLDRGRAQQVAITQLLQDQGFVVRPFAKAHGSTGLVDLVCTHDRSNAVYLLMTQWLEGGSIKSVSPLSQAQLQRRLARNPQLPIHQLLSQAIEQQRLVRMVAGIQWPITGTLAPTVYFIRPALVTP
ncbi:dermonecrotic toxin domain-containing protein [Pseudomonas sp. MPB26]|uniref:dermonecrotic toxin domain-containing protein n=1 Tax=Pseudomonas sp. MPB26 TaxID=3388491 RepID=UPI00398526FB